MRKHELATLREYVGKLSDEKLDAYDRMARMGELGELADQLSGDSTIDHLLAQAGSAEDFFKTLDVVGDMLKNEKARRDLSRKDAIT